MRLILFAASLLLIRMPQAQTATVEGIVVKLGTGEPVVRAQVVLSGANGGATGSLKTATDGNGKFVVRNVPAGRYRISAAHDGYIRAEYGQRTMGGPGKTVSCTFPRTALHPANSGSLQPHHDDLPTELQSLYSTTFKPLRRKP
jgi:hypothetical protein